MSSLQSQARKIERVLVKERAIIGAHHYTDAIITRWQTIEASENPKPNILAFISQIPGPEVHLPTEAAVIGYLEKCRGKDSAPTGAPCSPSSFEAWPQPKPQPVEVNCLADSGTI